MSLDTIIPGEIVNDELADWLTKLAARPDVQTVLEIGSSDGSGSTGAIVNGLLQKADTEWRMFCLEVSKPRFAALVKRYELLQPQMRFYNMASVPVEYLMPEKLVRRFYAEHPNWNICKYPVEEVLRWLKQDVAYIEEHRMPQGGIQKITKENAISSFDLVLIDGCAFSGWAEFALIEGAKFVVMDDTEDVKNHQANECLKWNSSKLGFKYELLAENKTLRNGFSVWSRFD